MAKLDLQRFLDAQQSSYSRVLDELLRGRKETHWIWFIFPQAAGLGTSSVSQWYAIRSPDEASAFAEHPILGARLRECVRLVLAARQPAAEVMGSTLDALKLRSSLTMFYRMTHESLFGEALRTLFADDECELTISFCRRRPTSSR